MLFRPLAAEISLAEIADFGISPRNDVGFADDLADDLADDPADDPARSEKPTAKRPAGRFAALYL